MFVAFLFFLLIRFEPRFFHFCRFSGKWQRRFRFPHLPLLPPTVFYFFVFIIATFIFYLSWGGGGREGEKRNEQAKGISSCSEVANSKIEGKTRISMAFDQSINQPLHGRQIAPSRRQCRGGGQGGIKGARREGGGGKKEGKLRPPPLDGGGGSGATTARHPVISTLHLIRAYRL